MAKDMPFKLTYATMFNPPEELHTRFEDALTAVKAKLGLEYPMIINGADARSQDTFEKRSPINTDLVLGLFQKGSKKDADAAISAARRAFPAWSGMPWQERLALFAQSGGYHR